ncbi:MAC/Perforin domain containing protein [Babesia caballi]|uniref:MAC/Perforin domain containing protein n=1 Tax=Babesia caballi TaxID=5871 RepID=A0AAV4LP62_BABCB|nr:MAC/Perforin domain containing protein [Babesia caballi]
MAFILCWLAVFLLVISSPAICHAPLKRAKKTKLTSSDAEFARKYVGLGYDAVFGNPFGSSGPNNDSGYRNPVIETHVHHSGRHIYEPATKGTWNREISTCWRSEAHEGVGDKDLLQELHNEFQLEGAESNELLEANLRSSMNGNDTTEHSGNYKIAKSFCAIGESGIVLPFNGKLSPSFVNDVANLPTDIAKLSACTPDVYVAEPSNKDCSNINKWMLFFKRYGTHITSHMVIDRAATASKQAKHDNNTTGDNPSTSVVENFESLMKGTRESRQMWVIGGFYVKGLEYNDLRAFKTWSNNIWRRPMPIRGSFSSLDHFMGDKARSYQDALQFYRNFQKIANGHSLNYRTLTEMLKETETVVSSGAIAYCPQNMVVVVGFVLTTKEPFHIDTCMASRTFCSSDVLREDAISMAICAKGTGFELTAIDSKGTLACPGDLVVAFGFQLFVDQSSVLQVAACPSGRSSLLWCNRTVGRRDCGEMPSKEGVEWKVCIRRNLLDNSFTPRTGVAKKRTRSVVNCPEPQRISSGKSHA